MLRGLHAVGLSWFFRNRLFGNRFFDRGIQASVLDHGLRARLLDDFLWLRNREQTCCTLLLLFHLAHLRQEVGEGASRYIKTVEADFTRQAELLLILIDVELVIEAIGLNG